MHVRLYRQVRVNYMCLAYVCFVQWCRILLIDSRTFGVELLWLRGFCTCCVILALRCFLLYFCLSSVCSITFWYLSTMPFFLCFLELVVSTLLWWVIWIGL